MIMVQQILAVFRFQWPEMRKVTRDTLICGESIFIVQKFKF